MFNAKSIHENEPVSKDDDFIKEEVLRTAPGLKPQCEIVVRSVVKKYLLGHFVVDRLQRAFQHGAMRWISGPFQLTHDS